MEFQIKNFHTRAHKSFKSRLYFFRETTCRNSIQIQINAWDVTATSLILQGPLKAYTQHQYLVGSSYICCSCYVWQHLIFQNFNFLAFQSHFNPCNAKNKGWLGDSCLNIVWDSWHVNASFELPFTTWDKNSLKSIPHQSNSLLLLVI